MDRPLLEASAADNVGRLRHLLVENPLLLEPFAFPIQQETPLHIAARNSQVDVLSEILSRKPGMGYVQNTQEGMCAIHLAAAAGSWHVVRAMLERDSQLGFAKDREGRTAAHVAAACGQVEVLTQIIDFDRRFAEERTEVEMETIMHMCARHNHLAAMKAIVELTGSSLLNATDRRGNTVLHTAAARGNRVVQSYLVEWTRIDVNRTNQQNYTARQLERSDDGYLHCNLTHVPSYTGDERSTRYFRRLEFITERKAQDKDWFIEKQNTILVVATVIAGATFQSGIDKSRDHTDFRVCNTISFALSLGLFVVFASGGRVMHWVQMRIVLILLWASLFFMSLAYGLLVMHKNEGRSKVAIIFMVTLCACMLLVLFGHLYTMFTYLVKELPGRRSEAAASPEAEAN